MSIQGDLEGGIAQERYRRFFEEDLTGNVVTRADGAIVHCNPAFVCIFGFRSTADAEAANFLELLRSPKDRAELLRLVRERRTVDQHELEMRDRGGEPVFVVGRIVGVFDDAGELNELHGYFYNDTKRKLLERQLIQAQKMEGLGTLAGGIAHDFNNILAIILGYTTQLEARNSNPEQVTSSIRVIKEAVERGASLVQQLLTSARQTEARLSSVDLNALVRELEKMLRATFPKMIGFDVRLESKFPLVTADRSQIHQVLLNLCVNARDAMANGGIITLETLLVPSSHVAHKFGVADAAKYACIRVSDNGSGMTADVKGHIFEPFFTTKERAKGTGLGLSVVYGVVNNHRGFVQVESEVGIGTTFSIYLPVSETAETAPDDVPLVRDSSMRVAADNHGGRGRGDAPRSRDSYPRRRRLQCAGGEGRDGSCRNVRPASRRDRTRDLRSRPPASRWTRGIPQDEGSETERPRDRRERLSRTGYALGNPQGWRDRHDPEAVRLPRVNRKDPLGYRRSAEPRRPSAALLTSLGLRVGRSSVSAAGLR